MMKQLKITFNKFSFIFLMILFLCGCEIIIVLCFFDVLKSHCLGWQVLDVLMPLVVFILTILFYKIQLKQQLDKSSIFKSVEGLRNQYNELSSTTGFKVNRIRIITSITPAFYLLNEGESAFWNFYQYFVSSLSKCPYSEVDRFQIISMWDVYCENLCSRDKFDAISKYIYTCTHLVFESSVPKSTKVALIKMIQGTLTSKELFCYFVNQVHYAHRCRNYNSHLIQLRNADFFHDLLISDEYKKIENHIPLEIEKMINPNVLND